MGNKDGTARPLCSLSYTQGSINFYATDFTLKHAPPPYGFGEHLEYQPAGPDYDTERDECHYGMQYFYIEEPFETSAAWSPLFTRKALQQSNMFVDLLPENKALMAHAGTDRWCGVQSLPIRADPNGG